MNKIITLIAVLTCLSLSALAQKGPKVKKSQAEYQINLTQSEFSEAEACKKCKELAMVKAIEKQFGIVVVQGNTTLIKNTTTGEETETTQIFNTIAETFVNGEWIETLDESCERFVYEEEFWVKCSIKGKVRELTQPKIELKTATLKCLTTNCISSDFEDGDSFYMYLKSPVDGYVTIFISDATTAQRLLPYAEMPKGMMNAVEVKADEEYILFSSAKDKLDLRGYVDEYELYAENDVDQNRIYVIYSEKPLIKPMLSKSDETEFEMPMELKFEELQRWMAKQKRYNPEMVVFRADISIKK
ncbi:MAG: DUF4384 domain-containing protein [Bacteroidia bacterium]|nr:DUF4384 domain-containing protein [Bacteroidia bacterium]